MQPMIEKLIEKGEGENQDFKLTITSLSKIAKTIVSFANTTGGRIIVGVSDKKVIIGIDPAEEMYMLDLAATHYCKPPVKISFTEETVEEDDKTILIARVEESIQKPHFAKLLNDTWIAYIRVKDRSIPAGKPFIKEMNKSFQTVVDKSKLISNLSKQEKRLLNFLTINDSITLNQAMHIQNYSKRRAIRMLTALVSKNLIRIHQNEKETYWTI